MYALFFRVLNPMLSKLLGGVSYMVSGIFAKLTPRFIFPDFLTSTPKRRSSPPSTLPSDIEYTLSHSRQPSASIPQHIYLSSLVQIVPTYEYLIPH